MTDDGPRTARCGCHCTGPICPDCGHRTTLAEAAAGPRDQALRKAAATLLSLIDTANVPRTESITLARTGTLLDAIERLRAALADSTTPGQGRS